MIKNNIKGRFNFTDGFLTCVFLIGKRENDQNENVNVRTVLIEQIEQVMKEIT